LVGLAARWTETMKSFVAFVTFFKISSFPSAKIFCGSSLLLLEEAGQFLNGGDDGVGGFARE
jgi:hypothetical protein